MIKRAVWGKWVDWMLKGEGIINGAAKDLSQKMVAELIIEVSVFYLRWGEMH
jgi:hypothetical protein